MDGQAEEGHRAKRSAQFRANGALHEFVLAPDDSCGRLHRSRRKTGGAKQLCPAVLKRIHRGHPGQEAMLDVSRYLWWPHMHIDIVNVAEE